MITGNLRVSRWVMLIEALGLFGPATLAWFMFTRALMGLNPDSFGMPPATPDGRYILALWIASAVGGLMAPIGLFFGLRFALRGTGLRDTRVGQALIALSLVAVVANIVAEFVFQPQEPMTNLPLVLLYWVFPLIGVVHLMRIGRFDGSAVPAA